MTLDASGNWMTGTTTAIGRATVVGGGTSQLAFHDGNGSGSNYGYLNYGGSSGELTLNANSTGGSTLIRFLTSNSGTNAERARIDSSGNFGIGTASPGTKLNLAMPAGAGTPQIRFDQASDNPYIEFDRWSGTASDYNAARIYTAGGNPNLVFAVAGTAAPIGSITFTEAARIDSSGNLLVGTTSATGDVSNSTSIYGGRFRTVSGSVSVPNATTTTLLTVPATLSSWIIAITANTDDAVNYSAVVSVNTQFNNATKVTVLVASALTFTMSNYSLQVSQGSGGSITFSYSAQRIL
jgi:hypothetical protein